MVILAIAEACEAYKRDKMPKFRLNGAMVYDQRILFWKGLERASILTLKGRKVPVRIGEYQRARTGRIRGQADLILKKGVFYLAVVVDAPEPSKFDPVDALGVDLGIVNLAVDSDGAAYGGEDVNKVTSRCERLKAKLQRCGTRSAKRHLKRLSGREKRFRRNVNHVISRRPVAKAKDTRRMIALEDLGDIRNGATVRRAQRRRRSSWGFRQLRSFIEHKAALAGVPVVVEPGGTFRTCPVCGCVKKRNRPNMGEFGCVSCGFAGPAGHVAALNIAARAAVNQTIVSWDFFGHFDLPQGQASSFKEG